MATKTYGEIITELVDEMKSKGTMGAFILERALCELVGAGDGDAVKIGGKFVFDHPGYQELEQIDQDLKDRLEALDKRIAETLGE